MKKILLVSLFLSILACKSDDQNINPFTLEDEIERGAVLRTLAINNLDFGVNNTNSTFDILLEEQDLEDGNLLERVEVYLSFIDNTVQNEDLSRKAELFTTIEKTEFDTSGILPTVQLSYTFQDFLEATNLDISQTSCTDQFQIDLELVLRDGRRFTTSNSGGTIVNNSGFFKSPFSYTVNVVEPISEDLFIGDYQLTHEVEGFFGPTFVVDRNVTLRKGHSINTRVFDFEIHMGTLEIEFTVACETAVVTRYQKIDWQCTQDFSDRVLIGPNNEPGELNDTDDSVLRLKYLEGFEGYDAFCGFSDFPAQIRLTKQ